MNFEVAVQTLTDAGVEFIIVGGWSAILHGSTYVTNDLDIFFSRDPENLKRLVAALAPFRPRLRDLPEGLPFLWEASTLANGTIFTLMTDLGAIDLLAEITGLGSYQDVKTRSVTVEAFGRRVRTLDLRSLIRSKRAISRDKDVHVVRELESLLEAEEPEA